MNTIARRVAAATALLAAPAIIALGTATMSHADTVSTQTGPSSSFNHPVQHPTFPNQTNMPQPGTAEHHRHQWNRG
jgi:acetyl-CoA acetyltransferase